MQQSLAQRHRVCGVSVAIIKDRKLISVDSAMGCPMASKVDAGSVFQAASLSKPVFAYAVLKLVEQGKMDLDAPVVQYLPQGYRHRFNALKPEPSDLVTEPRLQSVTVRMALNHTSGLPNWASGPLRFDSDPGARWNYSGEGFVLLQRAVEAVTGEPLDRFMATQVFAPLGMTHSSYVWEDRFAPDLLSGTKANGVARRTLKLSDPVAAFSLYTSAEDYGKFLAALLNDDPLLRRITASPAKVDPSLGLDWGLGWGIETTPGDLYLWQWGNNPGYRAFAMVSARTGNGFVMLTNGEQGLKLAEPIAQSVVPDEHTLFRSPILGEGVFPWLCSALGVCL